MPIGSIVFRLCKDRGVSKHKINSQIDEKMRDPAHKIMETVADPGWCLGFLGTTQKRSRMGGACWVDASLACERAVVPYVRVVRDSRARAGGVPVGLTLVSFGRLGRRGSVWGFSSPKWHTCGWCGIVEREQGRSRGGGGGGGQQRQLPPPPFFRDTDETFVDYLVQIKTFYDLQCYQKKLKINLLVFTSR